MYTVDNTTATSATLPKLQCNTEYTFWVYASGGQVNKTSAPGMVSLPARGMYMLNLSYYSLLHVVRNTIYHPSPTHSHWGHC